MDAGPDTGARLRGHVAVGVDGSRRSGLALEEAVTQAGRRGVPLEVVHGRPWSVPPKGGPVGSGGWEDGTPDTAVHTRSPEEARELAEAAVARVRELAPGLEVTASVVVEDAADALVELSRRAALTVVGSRGLGGFRGLLLGSVSLRAAAHVVGPLMVVRGELPPEHERVPRGTVLLGLEGEDDHAAVEAAFEEARTRDAALTVLHAWIYHRLAPPGEPLMPTGPLRQDMARIGRSEEVLVEQVLDPFRERYPEVTVRARTVTGGAARLLVEASGEADVAVVAAHRGRGRAALRLGPVVHSLLHHAHCPVLLVPAVRGGGGVGGVGGGGVR
ncbi:universal stress protein [Streptomyces sp. TRM43335]|uniref:Universal stress protein n=1 Tax=Streptomyces taklimakanensis TaxID=2569853 RepID=A0A6G2B765_9ACTN|nr:universal stress protein [Streptomyces taklimakanensis]MTE18101.1 universal stress protein [Streptomyces taklimakanensis]